MVAPSNAFMDCECPKPFSCTGNDDRGHQEGGAHHHPPKGTAAKLAHGCKAASSQQQVRHPFVCVPPVIDTRTCGALMQRTHSCKAAPSQQRVFSPPVIGSKMKSLCWALPGHVHF